jgi:hypothetical protein
MRILLIGPFGKGTLADSYAHAFERLEHEVLRFDCDEAYFHAAWYAGNRYLRRLMRSVLWGRINRRTVEVVQAGRPDFAMVFKGAYLHAATIRRLQDEERVPVFNYYPDNPFCGVPLDPRRTSAQRRDLISVLREYTRVYAWGEDLVTRLRADGVPAAYLPFAADTCIFRPSALAPRSRSGAAACSECGRAAHPVVFVGEHREKRERHVAMIKRSDVALWGKRWRRAARRLDGRHAVHDRPVFGSSNSALYSAAEVSLNILDDLNMPGHNMRTFEIPASGGIMLSTYTEEQAAFFPEGEAAWYYRDPAELDDLIDMLRRDKKLRDRTRSAALRIAREHDYLRRARAVAEDGAALLHGNQALECVPQRPVW